MWLGRWRAAEEEAGKGKMGKMGFCLWEEREKRMGIWAGIVVGVGGEVEEREAVVERLGGGFQWGKMAGGGSDGCG